MTGAPQKRIGRPPSPNPRGVTPVRTIRLSDDAAAELKHRGGREWLEPLLLQLRRERLG